MEMKPYQDVLLNGGDKLVALFNQLENVPVEGAKDLVTYSTQVGPNAVDNVARGFSETMAKSWELAGKNPGSDIPRILIGIVNLDNMQANAPMEILMKKQFVLMALENYKSQAMDVLKFGEVATIASLLAYTDAARKIVSAPKKIYRKIFGPKQGAAAV